MSSFQQPNSIAIIKKMEAKTKFIKIAPLVEQICEIINNKQLLTKKRGEDETKDTMSKVCVISISRFKRNEDTVC